MKPAEEKAKKWLRDLGLWGVGKFAEGLGPFLLVLRGADLIVKRGRSDFALYQKIQAANKARRVSNLLYIGRFGYPELVEPLKSNSPDL